MTVTIGQRVAVRTGTPRFKPEVWEDATVVGLDPEDVSTVFVIVDGETERRYSASYNLKSEGYRAKPVVPEPKQPSWLADPERGEW